MENATYGWVVSHKWLRHVTLHACISRVTYEWIMSHMDESCRTNHWDMSRVTQAFHSRRRSDLKYLDLQIRRFSRPPFGATGTPFTHVKICLKIWGLPRKKVWCVRGLLWKLVGNFGSRNYFKSDFLRLWSHVTYGWVMSHVDESCHTNDWDMSHVTHRTRVHVPWHVLHLWLGPWPTTIARVEVFFGNVFSKKAGIPRTSGSPHLTLFFSLASISQRWNWREWRRRRRRDRRPCANFQGVCSMQTSNLLLCWLRGLFFFQVTGGLESDYSSSM